MPAKKAKKSRKRASKRHRPLKVKHLTNATYWALKTIQAVHKALVVMDQDLNISVNEAFSQLVTSDSGNNPRNFNCPPPKK